MSGHGSLKELVVLVADLDCENAIKGLLQRPKSLGIQPLSEEDFRIQRHPGRDSSCRGDASNFLRQFIGVYRRALVVFDWHGSGARKESSAAGIENEVKEDLLRNGWQECCCIVLEPELESWIWSDSPVVECELGWKGRSPSLWEWMVARQYIKAVGEKPADPKDALRAALREARTQYSARLFYNLASSISLNRCHDRAFLRLRSVLRDWFG
jgi:hypothetical protein